MSLRWIACRFLLSLAFGFENGLVLKSSFAAYESGFFV
jgi:hypothetical protein